MGVKTRNLGNSEGKDIQWQAPLNADGSTIFNLESGKGYFINTTGGEVELKLPTGSIGDRIAVMDFGGTFNTNPIRLNLNGQKLNGSTNPSGQAGSGNYVKIDTQNVRFELVFSDSDKGWVVFENEAKSSPTTAPFASYITATGGTITNTGNFKVHSFTGDGCFVVTSVGNPLGGGDKVDYLVVAGGGGGGGVERAGGGGAGGFREGRTTGPDYTASPLVAPAGITLSASTTYPISVGSGGAAGASTADGGTGSNSVFSTITSAGGGSGRGAECGSGGAGGSGGGGNGEGGGSPGGAGNTPPVSPPQGTAGGNARTVPGCRGGGGGGGATQAAQPGQPPYSGGDGGNGATTHITGSPVVYSGGGGGGGNGNSPFRGGEGGTGGGGKGGGRPSPGGNSGVAGTANTGGGGGGASNDTCNAPGVGSAGGKGIVVLRYKFQN